jgi:hypothetical protein
MNKSRICASLTGDELVASLTWADKRFWPVCDMSGCPLHVRYRGRSGLNSLALRSSAPDPIPTCDERPPQNTFALRTMG